jgi:heme exporter protein B
MCILAIFSLPIAVVLFELDPSNAPWRFAGVILLGCAGMAAPGTLYSGLTARLASQQLMLPVLLFPLVVPTVLSAVKATNLFCFGDPMDQANSWMAVLVALNFLYWSLCGFLFSKVVDE